METTLFANAGPDGTVEYGVTDGTNTIRGVAVGHEPALFAAQFLNAARESHHKAGTSRPAGRNPGMTWVSIDGDAFAFTTNNPQMPGPGILLVFGGDANLCVSIDRESALELAKTIRDALEPSSGTP